MAGADDLKPDDRRQGERVPINDEFSRDASTWVSDLSPGGVFVHGAELLPVGSTIDLRFTVLLDDPIVIAAVGKVARHSRRPPGIGVQFVSLEPEMRARIDEVLERQRPLDSGAPLRLPEPAHGPKAPVVPKWGRAAPSGLAGVPGGIDDDDDDVTTSFERVPGDAGETPMFRPPPLPARVVIDEDERTRQYPKLRPGSDKPR